MQRHNSIWLLFASFVFVASLILDWGNWQIVNYGTQMPFPDGAPGWYYLTVVSAEVLSTLFDYAAVAVGLEEKHPNVGFFMILKAPLVISLCIAGLAAIWGPIVFLLLMGLTKRFSLSLRWDNSITILSQVVVLFFVLGVLYFHAANMWTRTISYGYYAYLIACSVLMYNFGKSPIQKGDSIPQSH